MRLFGYYAWHSFVNQLKKLFKTWVLVFILICGLMGGLIGYGAAVFEDAVSEEPEEVVEIEEEEAEWHLSISPDAVLELAVGGVVLGLFLYEAYSADKNGSKIFLPADVNLLFAAPMQPQSVLMFRLATQLGTTLALSIWMLFQLPNLILNLGLPVWTAAAILLTWFGALLTAKLIQVLLYTLCATTPRLKRYLRNGVYGLAILVTGGFLLFAMVGNLDILQSADRFFNSPVTRFVPFWGWLKGICVFCAQQQLGMALLCMAAVILGDVLLVFWIRHTHADFYEDAMAKSEETAAIMEKARSEKSTGVAAARTRKKDRKETLQRDGLNRGEGANVFFYKTLYNRVRFAKFGYFTKTAITYLVAAICTAVLTRFVLHSDTQLPVLLVLGGLVFFRAMGNSLEEDTGMDFFRMIPESTWKKLFYSQAGCTVNALLDLLVPMAVAALILNADFFRMLLWLPVILSVDFYASSVATFINLAVPVTSGKAIKQLVQILFIYFGLLPDIVFFAIGYVQDSIFLAALATACFNFLLGGLFFFLASMQIAPKGNDSSLLLYGVDLKLARSRFSRIGWSIFAFLGITFVLQMILMLIFLSASMGDWSIWLLTFLPQYGVGIPLAVWLMRKVPACPPDKKALGVKNGVAFFFISVFLLFLGNMIGSLILNLLSTFGTEAVNPLETFVTGQNLFAQILFMAVLAPIFEEFLFRKQLIDRMRNYGGKTAVILSALIFGLIHGNFSQFFYAFGLGLVFGYVYLNTGKLRYTIIAHMLINFFGGVFSTVVANHVEMGEELTLEAIRNNPWLGISELYGLFLIAGSVVGLVMLWRRRHSLHFPAGLQELPKGKGYITWWNVGMAAAILFCIAQFLLTL